jgi:hypothetical protein
MGWSDSDVADKVLRKMIEKGIKDTGTQNVFIHKGKHFFFEINTRKEYADGSVTGSLEEVMNFDRDDTSKWKMKRLGSYKIDGRTGKTRPAWLGEMVK